MCAANSRPRGSSTSRLRLFTILAVLTLVDATVFASELGREISVRHHLADGDEYTLAPHELVRHGAMLFDAMWTAQEGGGRPYSTGTGAALADSTSPLIFPRNFNRISGPDANSCAGCHNQPRSGGAGERVANVFVLGQRFDFASFDSNDLFPLRGGRDETGRSITLDTIANERNTVGMFGSGYIEMLARQMTQDLQSLRDRLSPGENTRLRSKGIDFGTLRRDLDGNWKTAEVEGLPAKSLVSHGAGHPPSLIIRPFHQAGAVVSLREFSNNAFNHHHGIQSSERFGAGDPDQDGFTAELTRADMTAIALFQATLAVPGRVIPRDARIERAVRSGERIFAAAGCADCHVPMLKLDRNGWYYSEPNPYNPQGNLQSGDAPEVAVDLNSRQFDLPRLRRVGRSVPVPAFTDMKLHDITARPDDPNCESLDMQFTPGSGEFLAGNCRFLTSRLWGIASSAPYFHHGKYTTLREAIDAHHGEAEYSFVRWRTLGADDKDALIEFLKSLRILPRGTQERIVDEDFRLRDWPAASP